MSSVGAILRGERERQGLDLERISQRTRINPRYLEAIEADDLSGLPGGFFYRSFVRQYAESLGLDEDAIGADLHRMLESDHVPGVGDSLVVHDPVDVPPLPAHYRSSSGNRLPLAIVLLITAVVASSALYALWQRLQQPADVAVQTAPAKQPVAAEAVPASTVSAANTAPGATQPETPPTPPVQAPSVEVSATEDVWVSIKVDGKEVVSRVLKPGESRRVNATGSISLLVGNAGGLSVTANGKPMEPIGPRGQVRVVEITATGANVRVPGETEN